MHSLLKTYEHGFNTSSSHWRARQRTRRLSLTEILADLDEDVPRRLVRGYHVKVGSERDPFWVHRSGDHYKVINTRPYEPPFATERDAVLAQTWFIEAMPNVPTRCEPVYTATVPVAV